MELKALGVMAIDALEVAENSRWKKRALTEELNSESPSMAADDTQQLVKKISAENYKLFRNIHSFLSCCANVSKLIWLNPKADSLDLQKRGVSKERIEEISRKLEAIRSKLQLNGKGTFYWENRELRNHLEHYNIRLFSLMAETGNMCSFRTCDSSSLSQRATDTTEKNYMRTFVVDTKQYIFQGSLYDLSKMEQDIRYLLHAIEENDPLRFSPRASPN